MKGRIVLAGLAGLLAAAPALSQNLEAPVSGCSAQDTRVEDACQKTVDVFAFMTPQLGVSLAGGNALLGARSNLGGLGHFSLGVRATAIQGKLPDFQSMSYSLSGAQRSDNRTDDQVLGAPGVELAVGLFRGFNTSLARVGSLEGIVSANYIPEYDDESFSLTAPDGSLKLGFGGRLGVIGEGPLLPGVSVSFLRRDLPTLDLSAVTTALGGAADDSLALQNFALKTTATRLVVQKNLVVLGLAAGIGQDKYAAAADLNSVVRSGGTSCNALAPCRVDVHYGQDVTRTTMFANATVNLVVFRLGAEVGQVTGGDVKTYNTFADRDPNDSLLFGSVAIRFGF
jgi:hypothetical protein